jgi:hypothetical protein
MPSPERDNRRQKAVYWPASGVTNLGQQTVATAANLRRELIVRWVPVKREVAAPDARNKSYDVEVIADRTLLIGSIMWLGGVDDLPSNGIPTSDLFEVVEDATTRDVKGRCAAYEYRLRRYNDALPTS